MVDMEENEQRVAAICKRLGSLWSECDEVAVCEEISVEIQQDCALTLFGKLLARSNINLSAFFDTMKKAWKVDRVECAVLEPGFFSFRFASEFDKNRVLEEGPWCFSRDLLVLKQCEPDTPDHCYEFLQCAFWVHLKGIPRGRLTEETIGNLANKIGPVLEVKLVSRGNYPTKSGKAKVILDLNAPLKSGTFYNLGYKKLWIDFRYERLPKYCYSCGCIGHYTTACEKIPYSDLKIEDKKHSKYGGWLRAEVRTNSPFWELCYGKDLPSPDDAVMEQKNTEEGDLSGFDRTENEVLSEGEIDAILSLEGELIKANSKSVMDSQLAINYSKIVPQVRQSPMLRKVPLLQELCVIEKIAHKKSSLTSREPGTPLLLTESPWNEERKEKSSIVKGKGKQVVKNRVSKKQRRFSPYEHACDLSNKFNEEALLDTPIQQVEEGNVWALVASPNKPPGYQ